jgi:hypothetical protein
MLDIIIRGYQTSLNTPNTQVLGNYKAKHELPEVTRGRITVHPRPRLLVAQNYASPESILGAKGVPAWILDSPREPPLTGSKKSASPKGIPSEGPASSPTLAKVLKKRKACTLNATDTNTCSTDDTTFNKGRCDHSQINFHHPR